MMTTKEAKEIYLDSDCSYFIMCTNHYNRYIQYRQLELPKEQEELWRKEKLQTLTAEIRRTGDYRIFLRLYDIASESRNYENLRILLNALKYVKQPLPPDESVTVAETILGRKSPKVRSGLIYWAYDMNQKAIAIILMDQALELIYHPNITSIETEKRIQKERRLCKKIITELKLNFSKRYLKHYYDF